MLTRARTRRTRLLAASLGLSIVATFGAAGIAAADNPHGTFDVTACTTPNGKDLIVTSSWSGMPVAAFSWFIETTDGSGGVMGPIAGGDAGTVTDTFSNVDSILSLTIAVHRAAGPNFHELDSVTLTPPADGWERCQQPSPRGSE